ncbi:hypothetical protein [Devosia lacusdianchii]|uniref:hypothetical protein n=1 Tax=Devosia lacusdianchii TaxID=2917991 RepID=UPI001F05A030|nr:hypothetical protein [Devosia sp. JXJ CY 41]
MEVKHYLSCYRAWGDADRAIATLGEQKISLSNWKIQWAGICAVMKTSIHLMRVDAKSCFSTELRDALKSRYDHLGKTKADHPIFWYFIDRERHNVLKEYQFSAYEAMIQDPSNEGKDLPSLLSAMMADKELRLQGGPYDGRLAIEVAKEASAWLQAYIEETIRIGGFEPEERIQWEGFLWKRMPKPDPNAPKWWEEALRGTDSATREDDVQPLPGPPQERSV